MSSATPTSYPEGPRHGQVTPDNHGDILLIVAWFLMVVMILATCLRLLIRFTTTHVPGIDDVVVSLATVIDRHRFDHCYIFERQQRARKTNLNTHSTSDIESRKVDVHHPTPHYESELMSVAFAQDAYVTTILYLLTISLAKISTLVLIARLTGVQFHLLLIRTVGAVVLLWTVASVFAVAFQCGVPRPWDRLGGKCFNPIIFWDIIGTVDILTDFILIALPSLIVWNLHMKWNRKLIVISAFTFRLVPIGTAIARLVLIRRLHGSSDPTYDSLAYAIMTQCQTTLSVVVACIPALKPYMDRAESGFLAVSLEQRAAGGTYGYGNSYHLRSMESNVPTSKSNTSQNGTKNTTRTKSDAFRSDQFDHSAVISSGKHGQDEAGRDDDRSSDGAGSERYIIQKTQVWNVSYEDDSHQQQPQPQPQNPPARASHELPSTDMVHAVSSI